MVEIDSTQLRTAGDQSAVLTWGRGVVAASRRRRVAMWRPCAIDPTGVRLYRWPMRSRVVPIERVDRFEVVLEQSEDGVGDVERLVLLTRDGKVAHVHAEAIRWLLGWRRLPLRTHAQHLNNHLLAAGRAATPTDARHPRTSGG